MTLSPLLLDITLVIFLLLMFGAIFYPGLKLIYLSIRARYRAFKNRKDFPHHTDLL